MNNPSNARKRIPIFVVPLLFGVLSLANIVGNPRYATIRPVDVVQLMASGMLLGAALVLLVQFFRSPRRH